MGMNISQFGRFMARVEATLEGLFPATIRISGTTYACTGVGGSAMLEYLDEGGQAPAGTRVFRVQKSILATRPETGTRIEWLTSPESVTRLTVIDSPDRPHETSWVLRCQPSDR
jgi:hypothetical protein